MSKHWNHNFADFSTRRVPDNVSYLQPAAQQQRHQCAVLQQQCMMISGNISNQPQQWTSGNISNAQQQWTSGNVSRLPHQQWAPAQTSYLSQKQVTSGNMGHLLQNSYIPQQQSAPVNISHLAQNQYIPYATSSSSQQLFRGSNDAQNFSHLASCLDTIPENFNSPQNRTISHRHALPISRPLARFIDSEDLLEGVGVDPSTAALQVNNLDDFDIFNLSAMNILDTTAPTVEQVPYQFAAIANTTKSTKTFACDRCEKKFKNKCSLKEHSKQHDNFSGYLCNICDKSFADRSTLTKHVRTHNGEQPYICGICKSKFSQSGNLRRHERKFH